MKFSKFAFLAISAVAMGLMTALPAWAGSDGHDDEHDETSFGAPGKANDVFRTINILAADMEFDVKELKIKDGETIRFIIKNTDEIEHDFTIGPPSLQAKHRKEMEEMMEKMGEGNTMSKMHKDPNAVFLAAGETKELIWKFGEVKNLEYACNVPGHYDAGMMGKFEEMQ